jgi:hypothetical protein
MVYPLVQTIEQVELTEKITLNINGRDWHYLFTPEKFAGSVKLKGRVIFINLNSTKCNLLTSRLRQKSLTIKCHPDDDDQTSQTRGEEFLMKMYVFYHVPSINMFYRDGEYIYVSTRNFDNIVKLDEQDLNLVREYLIYWREKTSQKRRDESKRDGFVCRSYQGKNYHFTNDIIYRDAIYRNKNKLDLTRKNIDENYEDEDKEMVKPSINPLPVKPTRPLPPVPIKSKLQLPKLPLPPLPPLPLSDPEEFIVHCADSDE